MSEHIPVSTFSIHVTLHYSLCFSRVLPQSEVKSLLPVSNFFNYRYSLPSKRKLWITRVEKPLTRFATESLKSHTILTRPLNILRSAPRVLRREDGPKSDYNCDDQVPDGTRSTTETVSLVSSSSSPFPTLQPFEQYQVMSPPFSENPSIVTLVPFVSPLYDSSLKSYLTYIFPCLFILRDRIPNSRSTYRHDI